MISKTSSLKIFSPYIITAGRIVFILVLVKVFLYFANIFVEKTYKVSSQKLPEKRVKTLTSLSKSIIKYAVYFIALIMILKEVGIDPMPILAGAGVIGLAVGFGAQTLIKDVIAGFFILSEDQFTVDEKVTIGNITGKVEEITLRCTKIRDEKDGGLVIFPNGSITQVTNHSRTNKESSL